MNSGTTLNRSKLTQRRSPDLDLWGKGRLRPGSLVQNYRKCGKPGCRCAAAQHPDHGPYWLITWSLRGKTRSRSIPASQVEASKAQIAECQRLRRLVAELIDVSDDLCQALRPACSLTALRRPLASKCFSPCRYLHDPLRLLPAGATVAGRDSNPLGNGAFSRRT